MDCPFCKSPKAGVIDSRKSKRDDRLTVRRRRCVACGASFPTVELPVSLPDLEAKLDMVQRFEELPANLLRAVSDVLKLTADDKDNQLIR